MEVDEYLEFKDGLVKVEARMAEWEKKYGQLERETVAVCEEMKLMVMKMEGDIIKKEV